LGHFAQRRAAAQEKYCDFVQDGIGGHWIWQELEAQSLLGVEGFAEGLRHLVREKQQIREIPKGQRFAGQPTLEKLFARRPSDKTARDQLIEKAVSELGYSQIELATFLGLHYSTISRVVAARLEQQNKNKDLARRNNPVRNCELNGLNGALDYCDCNGPVAAGFNTSHVLR
jgi:hypothetical protein